jgi:hypothetical protein
MCPADNATAGSLGRRRAGQLRFGFVAVLEGHIVYIPYPIQKSGKRIFFDPFFEWDMLKDIYPYFRDLHIFRSYPIFFLQYKFELCRGFFFCEM